MTAGGLADRVAEWIDDVLLLQEYQEIEEDQLREEHGPDGIPASEVFEIVRAHRY